MYQPIIVYKGRTTVVSLNLNKNVSGDTITSEIRAEDDSESTLIASWVVTFLTDGSDGKVILTLDNTLSGVITHSNGFMDVKHLSGGEPYPAFDGMLPVVFRETVTV